MEATLLSFIFAVGIIVCLFITNQTSLIGHRCFCENIKIDGLSVISGIAIGLSSMIYKLYLVVLDSSWATAKAILKLPIADIENV